ncbi:MAG: N-acetylmuramoyl-L-alanine amidase [Ruminococcus sp.]|nr:N-acetylmuramoyl-L-alanine amidase [Ruminococcus sp.]
MPYSIMLDAGHGGRDPGAVYNGRQEKDDNLALVLAIGEILQGNGIDVEYTRTTDVYESPYEKAMEANNAGVDFFISIHRNSFPTDNVVSGVESLVYDLSGLKLEMAENINSQLETIGFVNLGVSARPNLVVLKRTKMPAVLVEVGFINSDTDNQLLDQNFQAIAEAIAEGILDTLQSNGLLASPNDPPMQNMRPDMGNPPPQNMRPGMGNPPSQNMRPGMGNPPLQNIQPGQMPPTAPHAAYRVQVGAFRNPIYANRLLNELREQDFPASIYEENGFFLVQVGNFRDLNDAVKMEQRLKRAGYPTIILRYPRPRPR